MILPQFINQLGFNRATIRKDFIAALIVTAIAIPQSLGFAAIVGLPIITGLYCALLAPIVFALTTSSRHLIIGADSATAALVASGAATLAAAGSNQYPAAVAILGIATGIVLLVMSALRFGFLADLISKPVFVGFLAGIGVQLMIGRLPDILGIAATGSTLDKLITISTSLLAISPITVLFSLSLFGLVLVANRKRLPGALIALVAAMIATALLDLDARGLQVVGELPGGLPSFGLPALDFGQIATLTPSALAIAIVIVAQSSSLIRSAATRFDEPVDDNRDLAALGLANIASAFTQGFVVNGSPPRTAASEMSGGRTQLVNVFMAILIGIILIGATSALAYVPHAALAVIVFIIGARLLDIDKLRSIYHARPTEFWVALIALTGVILFGVQYGVAIAVLTSIIERLHRQYHPVDDVLLRDGKLAEWADERIAKHHKHRSAPPGVLVYRFASSIFFENAAYFSKRLFRAVERAKKPVTTVILDVGSVNDLDYTGADTLKSIYQKFSADDITLCLAHVPPALQQVLKEYHLDELIGPHNIYPSLEEAVFSHPASKRSAIEMVHRLDIPYTHDYIVIAGGVMDALGIRETNDVDLVVSPRLYKHYQQKGWREYIQDDGKKILSHHGYQIMLTYVGRDLDSLKKNAFIQNDVRFMSLEDVMACKHTVGRKKDLADIALIKQYLSTKV